MKFKKGEPRLPNAGRKKGSVNKASRIVRDILEANSFDLIQEILDSIKNIRDHSDRAKIMIQLVPYCYPKLQSITIDHTQLEDSGNAQMAAQLDAAYLAAAERKKND